MNKFKNLKNFSEKKYFMPKKIFTSFKCTILCKNGQDFLDMQYESKARMMKNGKKKRDKRQEKERKNEEKNKKTKREKNRDI